MHIDYKKLWKILIDRNMTKTDLRICSGISSSSLARLSKGEAVTTAVLLKICDTLGCNLSDILFSKDMANIKKRKITDEKE